MNTKVLSLVGGVAVTSGLLYFGSQKLISNEINEQITHLNDYGFAVEKRTKDANGEHFIIALEDVQKLAQSFSQNKATKRIFQDSTLKGTKLGVDVVTSGITVSADIYPVAVPTGDATEEKKKDISDWLAKKVITLHVDYNTLTDHFDGNLKDIDETRGETTIKLDGCTFAGDNKADKLAVNYQLHDFNMSDVQKQYVNLHGVTSDMVYEGENGYIQNGTTSVKELTISVPQRLSMYAQMKDLDFKVNTKVDNKLLSYIASMDMSHFSADIFSDKTELDNFKINYEFAGMNVDAMLEFIKYSQTTEPEELYTDPKGLAILEKMITKETQININTLSLDEMVLHGQKFKGFAADLHISLDETKDLFTKLRSNPMSVIPNLNVASKIKLSAELFEMLQQNPRARMLSMIPAKDEGGYKTYNLELEKGHLKVNDQPMM